MGTFIQRSFVGGMNRLIDPTRLAENEYSFLRNARNRYDVLSPIHSPLQIGAGLPVGNFQGVFTAGSVSVVFVSGVPYGRDFSIAGSSYTKLGKLSLDPSVTYVYAEIVPASTVNYTRKLKVTTDVYGGVTLFTLGDGSPQCLIVQDGINQPLVIFPDGTVRVTKKYADWSLTDREYVPIGKQMLFYSGILYVISVDGNQIFRSVTGRPLDFMVIIDTNGNKLSSETEGGAANISHRVDYNTVTAIRAAGTTFGDIVVTTRYSTYLVTPNYTQTVYGEPTFSNTYLFDLGGINHLSIVSLLGDNAIVSSSGIRSFNAVLQVRYAGKNAPFSAKINDLLDGIVQSRVATIEFDNYALFALNTKFGFAVLVYDMLTQVWTGFDQYEDVGVIKQFAVLRTEQERQLIFITEDNHLYQAFGDLNFFELAQAYLGEFCSNDPKMEQEPLALKMVFIDAKTQGTVYATPYMDRSKGIQHTKFLAQSITSSSPSLIPFGNAISADTARVISVDIKRERTLWKFGVLIEWDFDAKLSHIKFESNDKISTTSIEQATQERAAYSAGMPVFSDFKPKSAQPNKIITVTGENLDKVLGIMVGNITLTSFTLSSPLSLVFVIPDDGSATTDYIYLLTDSFKLKSSEPITIYPS